MNRCWKLGVALGLWLSGCAEQTTTPPAGEVAAEPTDEPTPSRAELEPPAWTTDGAARFRLAAGDDATTPTAAPRWMGGSETDAPGSPTGTTRPAHQTDGKPLLSAPDTDPTPLPDYPDDKAQAEARQQRRDNALRAIRERLGDTLSHDVSQVQHRRDGHGHLHADLGGGFGHATLARKRADGSLEIGCVASVEDAAAFLVPEPPHSTTPEADEESP